MPIDLLAGDAVYPKDHKAGMRVPKGGSSCAVCEYLKGPHECGNPHFIQWNDSNHFDPPSDEFCCDWFESSDKEVKASDGAEKSPLGWHGVDLDSTIAYYEKFKGMGVIGKPIMGQALMRVKSWLRAGEIVKIFTARARSKVAVAAIEKWCEKVLGQKLEVTDRKDEYMIDLLDDRVHTVEKNTGKILAVGTHEGALKGWDTRGRGKHESDDKVQGWKHGVVFPGEIYGLNGVQFHSIPKDFDLKKLIEVKNLTKPDLKEPPTPKLPEGMHFAAGIIMEEPDGRVWTVTPMNYYGGYVNTFPKGTVDKNESPQEAAIREVREETGLLAKITGYAGDLQRTTSVTRYYFGKRVGGAPWDSDEETYRVNLQPADKHLADRMRDAEGYITADHKLLNMHKEIPDNSGSILGQKIGEAAGTNAGGLYRGTDGVDRYVKFYKNPDQAYGEKLSNDLYNDLGISAPKSQVFENQGQKSIANDILPGKELNQVPLTKDLARDILKGFAADVLTINWDAVGLEHDNVLVDGKDVHRIDNGGTFLMRAQGGYKSESLLNGTGELSTFFTKLNPAYSKVTSAAGVSSYKDIPGIQDQVKKIVDLEAKSGGWDKYVKEHTQGYTPDKQEKIAGILKARTKGLWDATHDISASALWNGIQIVGFTGPEEEAIRSSLSRIPPELLEYVAVIESAKELAAKHGRYTPEDKKILFNPGNLVLKQRFGGGLNAIRHDILTLVHEVGHSLYDNLTADEKQQWIDLSGWKRVHGLGQAPAYVERRPGWEPYTSDWTHASGVKFPRYYAEKNPNEHFADCFAFFLLNKAYKLADNVREYFENYVAKHVHRYPQILIQSPIKAAADEMVAAFVTGMADAIHEGDNERSHGSVRERRKEIRKELRDWQSATSSGLSTSKLERTGGHAQKEHVQAFGTSEGVTKSWDTRGRGRHPKEDLYKKIFEEKELGVKPAPKVTYPEDLHPQSTAPQTEGKKKYKPGEKQKEKVEKFLSGDVKPSKGGKVSILGGIWGGNAAPVVVYKTMMTGEWHTIASLIQNADKSVVNKWNEDQKAALAKGDTKFWGVKERIESGIKRVTKAGKDFGQWSMEERTNSSTGYKEYKLVMGLVHDQAKGQEGITQDVQHKALQAIQKMVNNKGLDNSISKEAMKDYLDSVGVKNVGALTSAVSEWTGSAQSTGATKLKMIAAEYYGNDWSKEYANHNMTKFPGYDELKKQLLAVKALSNEYMKAAGYSNLYRGIKLTSSPQLLENIKTAKAKGEAIPVPLNSLSGFSTKASTASGFGGSGIVVKQTVKPEEVWVASGALPHLFGSFAHGEKEYFVGSKSNTVSYIDPSDVWIKGEKNPPAWVVDYLKDKYGKNYDPSKAGMV